MTDFRIRFAGVTKHYGAINVIDNLSLDIQAGEFVSLLGPSGSGKTTLLMMLAGFETASHGDIIVNGVTVNDLPPHKRDMGVVFQNYALFPHKTVGENVAFPLRMRGVGRSEIQQRVARALDMVQLSALSDRHPTQLSGGQQQRVALARALVFEPRVVLMDEPLGALDKQLREQMQLDIRELHNRLGLTIVFVTHDQSEALTMSDRIAVFNKGKIEQIGSPRDIYDRPQTRFVAQFIGETNLLEGRLVSIDGERAEVLLGSGVTIRVPASGLNVGQNVMVSVRPERLTLSDTPRPVNSLPVRMVDAVYQGDHLRAQLAGDNLTLTARLCRSQPEHSNGTQMQAHFDPRDCWMIAS
ncbi:ABC transporter ATP-binding protein [Pseudomonas tolaasii]|uniref:Spermidine/putrescine import ATP-binding protein PotA n=2 Tax=Pseudomonas tolaasii TaxID=29442 RepID=A0A7Y8AT83_PSETO|nr:ABC transporter ATP-binding protein [Pseudomonas tolaasii]ARB30234.1 Fe3+/spermidine/putrescine ABC transporter ATP-binding protein [Pseudomonas tolaasii]KAB0467136.1 ABC transporter ATP-binding protein [Pseudomonas tolaasii]MBW1249715.1 ABC transporter ATP-binding protein [Pseudomonas tolaasii]MBY8943226.1 ABC transporter ATP-binding protein [Pseudomonas tolaasii]NWC22743.1 ABC transporter ATP-binding protein [Pseudomonas tolaasii]